MDKDIRGKERQSYSGDPEAQLQFIRNLIRSARYDDLRNIIIDRSFDDLSAINRELVKYQNNICINLGGGFTYEIEQYRRLNDEADEGPDVIISQAMFSPPPPPPVAILQDYNPYQYISPLGSYGEVPHSELAMHSRVAGEQVVRYFLRQREYQPGKFVIASATVEVDNWPRIGLISGLPSEVLPDEVRRQLGGFRQERMPRDIFFYVSAEVRADVPSTWGRDERRSIGQIGLYYYPGLDQLYGRIDFSNLNIWHGMLSAVVSDALPQAKTVMI